MRRRYPVKEVMQDWNAGMATAELIEKYGFASRPALHSHIQYWRRVGFGFKRRNRPYRKSTARQRLVLTSIRRKSRDADIHIRPDHRET